mmetsp:Transcript_52686/g.111933  ORF Transcript_52686/g.111933 Transcript_52686/m.111933 type:complete len:84 (+) Transcript_52686:36-287(+)
MNPRDLQSEAFANRAQQPQKHTTGHGSIADSCRKSQACIPRVMIFRLEAIASQDDSDEKSISKIRLRDISQHYNVCRYFSGSL